jgi:hypothetical protein
MEQPMPIIRLTKRDPNIGATVPETDMDLVFVQYDEVAYQFDWTGRGGLLPLNAVQRAVNRPISGKDFRQYWIAMDGKFDWGPDDRMQILSARLAPRLVNPIHLSHEVRFVGLASPFDRVSFFIDPKLTEYAIDIYINPLSDGESGRGEYMQVNSP